MCSSFTQKPIPAMTTLQELIAQKDALQRQQQEIAKSIAEFQSAQRSGVINEIKTLMAQHGITAADLTATGRKAANPDKEPSKVAAKYRDPSTGSTWTGRGLKPRWLVAALESGRTQDEFLIENQAQ
ncbi:H-NS histone family protein [Sphaerotilus sp.]|jgi:DNA-binding protein H-NS|uniref:H-NS histone family protein n=1 Tax=Sphaerotilus sp. TaxID=2093942 RepID=UPI0025F2CE17|nr:H-NS histone family protein [Sphaerotilus sp.]